MPTLVIRNCPQHIHARIKAAAKANRRTVSEQVVYELGTYPRSLAGATIRPAKLLKRLPDDFVVRTIRELRDGRCKIDVSQAIPPR